MYLFSALIVGALFFACSEQLFEHESLTFHPIVMTRSGLVQGGSTFSRMDRVYYYFKGIPYAAPPVDKLRFKEPVSPKPWKHIRPATNHGNICVQRNELFEKNSKTRGCEDCLYINVYTPELPAINKVITLKPVMVYIHFGGFFTGDGNDDLFGPEYLMDKDVILVTFNYRLSLFGFLTTGDDASPGNYAFKDQLFALKWVRENINNFGGDRNRVTIFGQSAGAASVHHHILSPASKGYFNAAISQSSSALDIWAQPVNGSILNELATKKLAEFVKCSPNVTNQAMVDCLRSVDAYELADAIDKFRYFQIEPLNMFLPTLEVKTEKNPNPFITQMPVQIIQEKKFNNIPWIIGGVENEGILRAAPLLRNEEFRKKLSDNFAAYMPIMFGINLSVPPARVQTTYNQIIDYFLGQNSVNVTNPKWVQGFVDMFTDRVFRFGTYQAAMAHMLYGHSDLYYYNFNYRGMQSYGDKFALTCKDINYKWGVSHCDDLLYMFRSPRLFKDQIGQDCTMIDIMTDLWTNFATFFDPTPETGFVDGLRWTSTSQVNRCGNNMINNSALHYLNITGQYDGLIDMKMDNHYFPERLNFWTNLHLLEAVPNVY